MIWTDELKELRSSIKRVRDLHSPIEGYDYLICQACNAPGSKVLVPYPCLTIIKLDGKQK